MRLPMPISYAAGLRKDDDLAPDGLPELMKAGQDLRAANQVSKIISVF